ncbi:S66 peptidase family protein, partial [Achromobacter denitrificans]|uniref:S66 peptidase family protein n=2 Tax=Achromobacter denitrificans TaxID=32002 RepID=UPI0020C68F26
AAAPVRPAPPTPVGAAAAVPALKPGARIAIVAPASAAPDASDLASEWLEARGYAAQVMPASRTRLEAPYDYLAGTDAERLADLHAAFASPDIGAVWCLQGGFGSWRLLDQLDFGLIRRHPKPFIGYSDITALHLAMQRHAGFVTFHGPMLAQDLLAGKREPTESHLLAMIGGQVGQGAWIEPPLDAIATELIPGTATGRLVGGNLALIAALIGSPNEIDTRDAILFIEDVNEALPRVDRMLSQLAAAGKFDGLKGVLVGTFTRILGVQGDDAQAQGMLYPLILDQFRARGIPVLAGWPSGHGNPNLTLPLGARVTLDTGRGALRLEQAVAV